MVTPASLVLDFPFHGRWLARNSPARRIPSHGTHLLGTTYAIDFIPVDEAGRSAALTWRTLVSVEPPERFHGFGAPIVAPASGEVVLAHDGEPDHEARRSAFTLLPYAFGQARSRRLRRRRRPVDSGRIRNRRRWMTVARSCAERFLIATVPL